MKSITKKIFIYVLCALLSVSACSCSYVRSVYALEFVGGALAFEEALKWLLGAIGIVSAGGMTADYWENHGDDFVDYCAEQNITNAEVAEWQMKLCSGVLDKASSCWGAFKAWAKSLVSSNSGSGSDSDISYVGFYEGIPYTDFRLLMLNNLGINLPSSNENVSVYSFVINSDSNRSVWCTTSASDKNKIALINHSLHGVMLSFNSTFYVFSGNVNDGIYLNRVSSGNYGIGSYPYYASDNISISNDIQVNKIGIGEAVTSDFTGLQNVNTDSLDIIDSDIVDEENPEVAIPLPGLDTSDDTISSDTYDDIVDAINDGTISLDDGIAQIQDMLRVIVYDDTTDEVVPYQPDPDTGDNKTKDEVIQENRNNMGFTLFGLENVFPFCIPWDIFAFLNVLKAEPVAPVFNFPFPNIDDLEHPYMVRVDLSDWDDGMAIFRLAEDFLFIIGLAFLTRSLIGAGGDN